jgi:hypothetical protein
MKAIDLATEVEQSLNDTKLGYEIKQAQLYSVTKYGEYAIAGSHGDVYELLESDDSVAVANASDFIALVTCGWASPITDDDDDVNEVAPSQHPKRRRVRLFVLASRQSVASVLRFSDEPDSIVTDEGQATGSLADAVHSLFAKTRKNTN